MKYHLVGSLFYFLSISVFGETFTSRIHSIDPGSGTHEALILMEDGNTVFLSRTKKTNYSMEELRRSRALLKVSVDQNRTLQSLSILPRRAEHAPLISSSREPQTREAGPTVMSYAQAKSAFSHMRKDYQNASQCYNRAHVWSFEEFERTGMSSGKLFLFFTSRYIRNYRYKWWFHITPVAHVNGTAQRNWRTMDRRYTRGLLRTKTWTNIFMENNARCPVVTAYSAYQNNQDSEDCYLIPTTMYYWQPRDIEGFERNGFEKTNYINWEVRHAYWEAF